MQPYTIGTILIRTFKDYSKVEVVGTHDEYTIIKDQNGRHFIPTNKLEHYFTIVEPETIIKKNAEHQNLDDPEHHNIAGAFPMNRPTNDQLYKD